MNEEKKKSLTLLKYHAWVLVLVLTANNECEKGF